MNRTGRWWVVAALAVGAGALARAQAPASALMGFSPQAAQDEAQWEEKFRAIPQPANIRQFMYVLSKEPHAVGQPYDERNAQYILQQFKSFSLDAHIETFYVLFPTPLEREVEMVQPTRYALRLKERAIPEDADSSDEGQLPTYNAYSSDGDVTAPLVYVNYGLPADYEQLAKMHIDVTGKIVLARYGESWRGIKPKVAAEHGAVGCLIYSDPRDDGYFEGDTFPKGPYRPPDAVQRGSVADDALYEGDPLTPGIGATKDAKRLTLEQAKDLFTKIPTLPISYADALPLLKAVGGPVAPEDWRGALPITYHVGPGETAVHLKVKFDWSLHPVNDVVAVIPGAVWPDQWVIQGNHHDAWVNGANDPVSGMSAEMEEARTLGALLKQGWRPKRTIVLAAWDGEEPGLLGSTEWAETHAAELQQKAVAYINCDNSTSGVLRVQGSHTLEKFINQLMKAVPDPETGKSLWEMTRERELRMARSDAARQAIANRPDLRIGALGSGSDYATFIDHLGIAAADLRFTGAGYGVYHSIYDDFYWYTHFGDPDFIYERTLAETMGTLMMRLAAAQALPFDFTDFADTVATYVQQLKELHQNAANAPAFDFTALDAGLGRLRKAAADYAQAYQSAAGSGALFEESPAALGALNQLLYQAERKMTTPEGLPAPRGWYKNELYAPGAYTGYAVKTLPAIREAMEQNQWRVAQEQERTVGEVLQAVAAQIDSAREKL
ncbi:MAG TPA: M28 family metallopeptidase [Candidatus Acidoferrales bacterium]|nr:M28 family metallopeptidase [Candidatus Acidoferrales bacterium]